MMVRISGHYGDPKAHNSFSSTKKKLNDCFKKHLNGSYFRTLVLLSIVFRVSGKVRDFGAKGPERMKHIKKNSEITIDLVFPECSWRGVESSEIEKNVVNGVLECLKLMIEKAESLDESKNLEALNQDIEKAISEFNKD